MRVESLVQVNEQSIISYEYQLVLDAPLQLTEDGTYLCTEDLLSDIRLLVIDHQSYSTNRVFISLDNFYVNTF